jgi:hypothetical protein
MSSVEMAWQEGRAAKRRVLASNETMRFDGAAIIVLNLWAASQVELRF